MSLLWLLIRIGTGVLFLTLVIMSIPLAFEVGGRQCGLAFSLSLVMFYCGLSTLKLVVPTNYRVLKVLVGTTNLIQYLVVPALMIYCLDRFSNEDEASGSSQGKKSDSQLTWLENWLISWWDWFLKGSAAMFQLAEGFCSLLVIQTFGQISRWLVNRNKSDSWMIALLVISGSTIASTLYFLWRIYNFPTIGNIDATLIGVSITCAIILGAYGIASGKGNPVESSLLFSYIVLCIYQIFTDYKPNNPSVAEAEATKPDFPPFPPVIMESYATLASSLAHMVPVTVTQTLSFFVAALSTITASVIISLAYRLFVFYSATRIIPAVRENGARGLDRSPSIEDEEPSSKIAGLLSQYSSAILVAVYTHLLMQHFAVMDSNPTRTTGGFTFQTPVGGHMWRWVNVGATMALYAIELVLGDDDGETGLTSHWKTE